MRMTPESIPYVILVFAGVYVLFLAARSRKIGGKAGVVAVVALIALSLATCGIAQMMIISQRQHATLTRQALERLPTARNYVAGLGGGLLVVLLLTGNLSIKRRPGEPSDEERRTS